MSGAIDVMEALMASGADVNVINQDHSTPLMFACQSNNMYAASLLLANGASVRVKNLQGKQIEKTVKLQNALNLCSVIVEESNFSDVAYNF